MNREMAEVLALKALTFLLADEELAPIFLGATGIGLQELATRAGETTVLVGVLNFLIQDDAWIRAFCAETGYALTDPQHALWALPGGAPVHWT